MRPTSGDYGSDTAYYTFSPRVFLSWHSQYTMRTTALYMYTLRVQCHCPCPTFTLCTNFTTLGIYLTMRPQLHNMHAASQSSALQTRSSLQRKPKGHQSAVASRSLRRLQPLQKETLSTKSTSTFACSAVAAKGRQSCAGTSRRAAPSLRRSSATARTVSCHTKHLSSQNSTTILQSARKPR